ncbi:MAG: transcriptional activator NhaR [Bradymonadia bacterium]
MEWLNYHHLHYFWVVAQEGGVQAASRQLRVSPSTVSTQLKALEAQIGSPLFRRAGRGLAITDVGQLVLRYAHDIFSIGEELKDVINGRLEGRPQRFAVGVADVLPKHVAHRLLAPAIAEERDLRLFCRADHPDALLSDLAAHRLDVVLTDAPAGAESPVKVYNHLLGESALCVFATPELRARHGDVLPGCLDGAPLLLPTRGTVLRGLIEHWLQRHGVRPQIVGEFEDSGILKIFGGHGLGLFIQPELVADEIVQGFGVQVVGTLDGVVDRFYCLTAERRLVHPVTARLVSNAREVLQQS